MRLLLLSSLLLCACSSTLPTPFLEGTQVLPPNAIGLTLGGGGGIVGCNQCNAIYAAGGEARLRVGIGNHQEIGATGFGGAFGSGSSTSQASSSWAYVFGGSISYKVAPVPWLAFVASGGALDQQETAVFTGDLAAIVAPYTDSRGTQLYSGARGSFAIPVLSGAHGASEALTVPLGLSLRSGGDVHVFLEGGLVVGFNQFTDETTPTVNSDTTLIGGYASIGVLMIIR